MPHYELVVALRELDRKRRARERLKHRLKKLLARALLALSATPWPS